MRVNKLYFVNISKLSLNIIKSLLYTIKARIILCPMGYTLWWCSWMYWWFWWDEMWSSWMDFANCLPWNIHLDIFYPICLLLHTNQWKDWWLKFEKMPRWTRWQWQFSILVCALWQKTAKIWYYCLPAFCEKLVIFNLLFPLFDFFVRTGFYRNQSTNHQKDQSRL